jgi:Stress up-regulated Nod 19
MRKLKRPRALLFAGIAMALLASGWGAGVSSAQEHPHPTTTAPGPGPSTTEHPHPTTPSTTAPTNPNPNQPQPIGTKRTIRYGPFTIPGAPTNPDGTHGHAHTGNMFQFGIQKPCSDCFVTSLAADLVYADGTQANWSNDAQLHHMVMFNSAWGKSDATCSASVLGFLGQRFFAAGDERTKVISPQGYGYYTGWFDSWSMIYELANHQTTPKQVYISMDYWYVPASWGQAPGMTNVEPVWMDIDQCGDSEYTTPQGPSQQRWTWTVNRPGRIIGAGGHLHDGGVNLDIRNDSTGARICNSVAGYGETPAYVGHHGERHISSMSTCTAAGSSPVATVSNGQRVSITANYDQPASVPDAMGIALLYVAP